MITGTDGQMTLLVPKEREDRFSAMQTQRADEWDWGCRTPETQTMNQRGGRGDREAAAIVAYPKRRERADG